MAIAAFLEAGSSAGGGGCIVGSASDADAAPGGPWDTTVSIYTTETNSLQAKYQSKRAAAYQLQDRLHALLPLGSRECACHRGAAHPSSSSGIPVAYADTGEYRTARYRGVFCCGNVWVCPICAPVIAARRADEIGSILRCMDVEGFRVLKLAFTCSHSLGDSLADLLDRQQKAHANFSNSRLVKRVRGEIGYVDNITAKEATYSPKSGWHPHQHEYWVCNLPDNFDLVEVAKALELEWIRALKKQGLVGGNGVALWVGLMKRDEIKTAAGYLGKAGCAAGYLSKAGAAIELSGLHYKQGKDHRQGHFAPMQLLAVGEKWANELFLEFFHAFRYRKQIVIGRVLKLSYQGMDLDESNGDIVQKADKLKPCEQVAFVIPPGGLKVLRRYGVAMRVLELVESKEESKAWDLVCDTLEKARDDDYRNAVIYLKAKGRGF